MLRILFPRWHAQCSCNPQRVTNTHVSRGLAGILPVSDAAGIGRLTTMAQDSKDSRNSTLAFRVDLDLAAAPWPSLQLH